MAVQVEKPGTWIDPYLKVREKTLERNFVYDVMTRYGKMAFYARQQHEALCQQPKVRAKTLEFLVSINDRCAELMEPLNEVLNALDAELSDMTARLENEQ